MNGFNFHVEFMFTKMYKRKDLFNSYIFDWYLHKHTPTSDIHTHADAHTNAHTHTNVHQQTYQRS